MSKAPAVRTGPSSDDAHAIVFFRRHVDDDPNQRAPGRYALDSYPASVRAKMRAALVVVDGRDKPVRVTLSDVDYAAVRRLGEEYRKQNPRSVI